MKPPFSRVPAMPVALGLAAGIMADASVSQDMLSLAVGATIVVAGCLLFFLRRRQSWWASLVMFCGMGMLWSLARRPAEPPAEIVGKPGVLTARVDAVSQREGSTMLYVTAMGWRGDGLTATTDFKAAVTVGGMDCRLVAGDIAEFEGTVKDFSTKDPVPDAFDFTRHLSAQGLTATMYVAPGGSALLSSNPSLLERWHTLSSATLAHAIVSSGVNGATAGFMLATIAGDDLYLEPWLGEGFRATGLAHMLALSGLHVGIVIALATALLRAIRMLPRGRRVFDVLLLLLIFGYALTVGMSPSVCRAAVMAAVYVTARMMCRQSTPYNSLCVAVAVLLLANPWWLFAPGFQLSVVAVWSLLFGDGLMGKLIPADSAWRPVARMLTVPVWAMAGTMMLTMLYFHALPLMFLPANILGSLLVGPLVMLGVVLVLLTLVGIPAGWLATVEDWLYESLQRLVASMSSWGATELTGIYPEGWQIAVYAISLTAFAVAVTLGRERVAWLSATAMVAVLAMVIASPPLPGSEMYVASDAVSTEVILRHDDRAMLVTTSDDAEAAAEQANRRYRDFLCRRGCGTVLNALTATLTSEAAHAAAIHSGAADGRCCWSEATVCG